MAKIRCFLCGGRVSGGVCKECGMPQRQHAQNYSLNESSCDNQPLTHVHNEHDKSKNRNTYAGREHRKEKRKASGKFPLKAIVAIIVILWIIAVVCFAFVGIKSVRGDISDIFRELDVQNVPDEAIEIFGDNDKDIAIDESEYDFTTYELGDSVTIYQNTLTAGHYIVGYHIPEGVYIFTMADGRGALDIYNEEQSIYLYKYMDALCEDGPAVIRNLKLYNGTEVILTGDVQCQIQTSCAGAQMERIPNPLTESVKVGSEPMQAGIDFPTGVYDLYLTGDFDYVSIYTLDDTGEETYYYGYLLKDDQVDEYNENYVDYAECIKYVNIEKGTYIHIDDNANVLELVPSVYTVPQEGEQDGEYY